jgi:threonine dehydratase
LRVGWQLRAGDGLRGPETGHSVGGVRSRIGQSVEAGSDAGAGSRGSAGCRDFDEAKEHGQAFAEETGARWIVDGREPAIAEGAGTIAVELCRWPHAFDVALIPLGNGALLGGIATWLKAKSPATRRIGVCAAGAPSMALSLKHGRPESTESMATIADGIGVRVPVPEALADLAGVVDEVLLVDDQAMIDAMRLVFRQHGLVVEPAGVAGLAAAITFRDRFRGASVVTPLCGGNLTPEQIRDWLF